MRLLTALTTANITNTANGIISVNAGGTPGFCHIKVTGMDGTVTQTQGGWIVVGTPAATFTETAQQARPQHGFAERKSKSPPCPAKRPGTSMGHPPRYT